MIRKNIFISFILIAIAQLSVNAWAEEAFNVKGVLTTKEQIRYDFPTPDNHFMNMVKREGMLTGTGFLDKVEVVEYATHDIIPDKEGLAGGYLVAEIRPGSKVIIKWQMQVTFITPTDGRPLNADGGDSGVWRFVGGTGPFEHISGAGTMKIRPLTQTDREFSFEGKYYVPPAELKK